MRSITAVLIGLGSLTIGSSALAEGEKVIICHAAGREGTTHYETLEVSTNAVFKDQGGHFYENGTPAAGHEEDYLGPCDIPPTTSTTTSTTVVPSSSTTSPASETTAVEITSTSSTSTLSPSSLPPESNRVPDSTSPTTVSPTTSVELTTPVIPTQPTTSLVPSTTRKLPETGDNTGHLALIALGLTLIGGGATALARRKG
jgi:LPXTG-motif cell wall-anchored protein